MNSQLNLPEEDIANTILADLKRVTREYATAATESVCPQIRQMFTNLLNETLAMQGDLYTTLKQANLYNASSPVLQQEIDKQVAQYKQTQQKTSQFAQQSAVQVQ
ncbi:spore coat protein [Paenibacillus sacheonensis]|uniref:Spore coat protein n=1 Tax=Paenibacillus sacheonensis TaxID=742054 RepID=A0A7X5BZF0_9BACL|nr:spore coat protein [Paenibacillus sacheonensis]MBM7566218.1 spore coat protein F [Paenibacillus sacheonensis]NBC70426.1 spore coat protein [Paenibacillus sacheonensis]